MKKQIVFSGALIVCSIIALFSGYSLGTMKPPTVIETTRTLFIQTQEIRQEFCYPLGHYDLTQSTKPFAIVDNTFGITATYTWLNTSKWNRMLNYTQGSPKLLLHVVGNNYHFDDNLAPSDTINFDFTNSSAIYQTDIYITIIGSLCTK